MGFGILVAGAKSSGSRAELFVCYKEPLDICLKRTEQILD